VNREVTDIVMDGIAGKTVTFKAGFWPIAESDFATLFTGIVDDYELTSDGTAYRITVRDAAALANETTFEAATSQIDVADISSSDTSVTLKLVQFFSASGYILIDSEIIQYTGKSGVALTGLTRGAKGTTPAAHTIGATVQEVIVLGPAHPLDIAVSVLTNTGKTGLGISASLVDSAEFTAMKAVVGDGLLFEFHLKESQNGKQWLEQEIFSPLAAYPVVLGNGKISLKVYRQPVPAQLDGSIDEDSIIGIPQWSANLKSLVNDVTIYYDYDVVTGSFQGSANYTDAASIAANGRHKRYIRMRGARSSFADTMLYIEERATAILQRYKNPAPIVRVQTHFGKNLIEAGDIVELSSAILPNRDTGLRGVTDSLVEVVNREPDFSRGLMGFDLLLAGFSELAQVWSEDSIPDYTSSSAAQRANYCYWTDDAGLNPDSTPGDNWGT
jgi:hypothetical protein